MQVAILVDNRSRDVQYVCEHGLSVYINVDNEQYLFDTGQTNKFVVNANRLNIDLTKLNGVVISHGHYDHAGGLKNLLDIAPHTPIYMNFWATRPKYSVSDIMTKPNGFPNCEILKHTSINYISNIQKISKHLTLFTLPHSAPANTHLMIDSPNGLTPDPFDDEIFALISENDKNVIFGGCTHHGLNQLFDFCHKKMGLNHLSAFIGGLHLTGRTTEEIKESLNATKEINVTTWIVNHCSGDDAIKIWQKKFNTHPEQGFAGSIFEL